MKTAKIFKNGNSQAVRLPKEYQFDVSEVEVIKRGDEIILRKKKQNLKEAFTILTSMPDDYFDEGRKDPIPEARESFD
jgi:antitoxin VapB